MKFNKEVSDHRLGELVPESPIGAQPSALDLPDTSAHALHSGQVVTPLDRWIARKMMAVVGNPPVVLKLWDGGEVTQPQAQPGCTPAIS